MDLQGKLSIFFKLAFDQSQLLENLSNINGFKIISRTLEASSFDATFYNLGSLVIDQLKYQFYYNAQRYLFTIVGSIKFLDQVLESIFQVFNDNYSLDQTAQFLEFNVNERLPDQDLVKQLHSKIQIIPPTDIQKTFDIDFLSSGIVLASSLKPLDTNWFSIRLLPEPISSSGRMQIWVLKRQDNNFREMIDFLRKIKDIHYLLLNWLKS